jgi:hypothetical protein
MTDAFKHRDRVLDLRVSTIRLQNSTTELEGIIQAVPLLVNPRNDTTRVQS